MKKYRLILSALTLTLAMSSPAWAAGWNQDMNGFWFEQEDGTKCRNGWYWIDGDSDGWGECYYFGNDGYLIDQNQQVDGWEIGEEGAWTVKGEVQVEYMGEEGSENDPEAVAAYQAAMEKNKELASYEADVDSVIRLSVDGATVDMTMDMNMKTKAEEEDLQLLCLGTMGMMGVEFPYTMFYTDGYMYTDMMGEKMKAPMPVDEALAQANSNMEGADLDLSMINGMRVRKNGDQTILAYCMNTGAMDELLGAAATEYSEDVKTQPRVRASIGKMVIDGQGYVESQTMYLSMEMDVTEDGETQTVAYEINMDIFYKNPGKEVKFSLPSTEGFEEAS